MSELRDPSTFAYVQGDQITLKLRAFNSRGWGEYSDTATLGDLIEDIPEQMAAPTRGSLTSEDEVIVNWIPLTGTETGGADIDSYNLQVSDSGADSWTDLVGEDENYQILDTFTHTPVVGGNSYDYRVRAHNAHGWSEPSDIITIVAASAPA